MDLSYEILGKIGWAVALSCGLVNIVMADVIILTLDDFIESKYKDMRDLIFGLALTVCLIVVLSVAWFTIAVFENNGILAGMIQFIFMIINLLLYNKLSKAYKALKDKNFKEIKF